MSPIERAACRAINHYVEVFEGNWKEIRIEVLRDIDLLLQNGGEGHKMFAYALDRMYHELAPRTRQ